MHHRDGLDCFQYRLFEPIIKETTPMRISVSLIQDRHKLKDFLRRRYTQLPRPLAAKPIKTYSASPT